jgi:leucine dehydrogenase
MLDALARHHIERLLVIRDEPSGLEALIVIDDVTLGPAVGGVRTRSYGSLDAALHDVAALARAMTVKCALAGLAAGGGKAVVLDHSGLERTRAFTVLGERIAELGGLFRTAGDLGTTAADLAAMARHCPYVHTDESTLAAAVARGMIRCIEACVRLRGGDPAHLEGLRVAVQGVGAIGAAVVEALAARGVFLTVADVDGARAAAIGQKVGAEVVRPDDVLTADVDVVAPCAIGGVVTADTAAAIQAWALCGAANNIVADDRAARVLADRGIAVVPDVIASAGAVIDGIGASVMGLADRTPLIDRLGETAYELLVEARETRRPAGTLAIDRARVKLAAARAAARR